MANKDAKPFGVEKQDFNETRKPGLSEHEKVPSRS